MALNGETMTVYIYSVIKVHKGYYTQNTRGCKPQVQLTGYIELIV